MSKRLPGDARVADLAHAKFMKDQRNKGTAGRSIRTLSPDELQARTSRSVNIANPADNTDSLSQEMEGLIQLKISDVDPYDKNPRQHENERYDDIKESIRVTNVLSPLVVTRRPGATRYMVGAGGNTRLKAQQELWAETGEARFLMQDAFEDDATAGTKKIRPLDPAQIVTALESAVASRLSQLVVDVQALRQLAETYPKASLDELRLRHRKHTSGAVPPPIVRPAPRNEDAAPRWRPGWGLAQSSPRPGALWQRHKPPPLSARHPWTTNSTQRIRPMTIPTWTRMPTPMAAPRMRSSPSPARAVSPICFDCARPCPAAPTWISLPRAPSLTMMKPNHIAMLSLRVRVTKNGENRSRWASSTCGRPPRVSTRHGRGRLSRHSRRTSF